MTFDVNRALSLKQETRESRGADGMRISLQKETPIQHKNFGKFLKVGENKTALFNMIADAITFIQCETTIVSTRESSVVSNRMLNFSELQPCSQEEADTCLFWHVKDASVNGIKKVMIITVDTGVVLITTFVFSSLELQELWIEFGSGKNKKCLPIHQNAAALGENLCRALPFWYALTGCDTVSHFANCGKKTAWNTWMSYKEVTQCFERLSSLPELTCEDMGSIARFVILMYEQVH